MQAAPRKSLCFELVAIHGRTAFSVKHGAFFVLIYIRQRGSAHFCSSRRVGNAPESTRPTPCRTNFDMCLSSCGGASSTLRCTPKCAASPQRRRKCRPLSAKCDSKSGRLRSSDCDSCEQIFAEDDRRIHAEHDALRELIELEARSDEQKAKLEREMQLLANVDKARTRHNEWLAKMKEEVMCRANTCRSFSGAACSLCSRVARARGAKSRAS